MSSERSQGGSDTDTASESEALSVRDEHNYARSNPTDLGDISCTQSTTVPKKPRGPFSMEKCQHEFEQLKSSKMKQISLFEECCKVCHKTFETLTESDIHVRKSDCSEKKSKKKSSGETYSCHSCDLNFTVKKKYSRHCESFHPTEEYKCHECDKSFTIRRSWQRHKQEVHEIDEFACSTCNFTTKRSIFQHESISSNILLFISGAIF